MDAGPSCSYQHDVKNALPLKMEGKQTCMVYAYTLLLCTSGS
ncbi:hypothetical protein MgSA37_02971 [Mucilaginibacter gotjawali]|uniref:Uncharacterized protein n=2 Tax=Mucilaginibacter gotjawali TaxID=1550579 RepID=A0A110B5U7_9SPHI|nr:hypothetical protein [Mucilaginibacter gotjawali]BAU54793.1 hypothetical protein MgSA37_02971 [Mucilaginibacter gotjawali]